jgi:hypothetical protein
VSGDGLDDCLQVLAKAQSDRERPAARRVTSWAALVVDRIFFKVDAVTRPDERSSAYRH